MYLPFRIHEARSLNVGACPLAKRNLWFSSSSWDLERPNLSHSSCCSRTVPKEWNRPSRDRENIRSLTSSDLYRGQVAWCPWCRLACPWLSLRPLRRWTTHHRVPAEPASQLLVLGNKTSCSTPSISIYMKFVWYIAAIKIKKILLIVKAYFI